MSNKLTHDYPDSTGATPTELLKKYQGACFVYLKHLGKGYVLLDAAWLADGDIWGLILEDMGTGTKISMSIDRFKDRLASETLKLT
jgi:hypothetical protein